jgi:translation initiation factor 2 beta subunit (eIF-2beta)/eIF-5
MTDHEPADFLKCPECNRTTTTSLTICLDRDVLLECSACDAIAIAHPLHEQDVTYE